MKRQNVSCELTIGLACHCEPRRDVAISRIVRDRMLEGLLRQALSCVPRNDSLPKLSFNIFNILFVFLIYNYLFLIFAPRINKTHAQGLSLSISPPLLEVLIKPGKSITQIYKITNQGEPVILIPRLVQLTEAGLPAGLSAGKAGEAGIKENKDFKPEAWINIVTTGISFERRFFLKQGEEKEILLRINPPANLPENEIYRALLFSTTPNPESETSQVNISQSIGSILLLNVSPTGFAKKEAQITRFELSRWLDSFDPLKILIEVKNTGNTFFRTVGQLTLKGPVGTGSFKLDPNIILINQKRILTTETSKNNQRRTTLFLPGFFLGKYQIEMLFTLDDGTIKVSQTRTFYAVPWKLGIIFIILPSFLYLLFKKKRQIRKPKGINYSAVAK